MNRPANAIVGRVFRQALRHHRRTLRTLGVIDAAHAAGTADPTADAADNCALDAAAAAESALVEAILAYDPAPSGTPRDKRRRKYRHRPRAVLHGGRLYAAASIDAGMGMAQPAPAGIDVMRLVSFDAADVTLADGTPALAPRAGGSIDLNIPAPGAYRIRFGKAPRVERIGLACGTVDLAKVVQSAKRAARLAIKYGHGEADAFEAVDSELTDGDDRIGRSNPLTFCRYGDCPLHPADVAEARRLARKAIRRVFRRHRAAAK